MRNPELIFPTSLLVTDQKVDISEFSRRQKTFYLNLFWETVALYQSRNKPRVVVGIAGPTGAGKSVVAVLFKELAKQARLSFAFESITIDAYHYANSFLNSHFSEGEPLKKVKGRFDTYAVQKLASDVQRFCSGQKVAFPIYSRKLHDPVENGVVVEAKHSLLIVEGLWLLYDQGGWETIGSLLDFSFFIDSEKEKAKEPVIKRHMAGGRTFEDASRHYELVDGKNSDLVLTTKPRADRVIPPYYLV
jgi:pantothenate kinase